MDETWTIDELVEEVQRRIAALPKPQNGQVRAVPDDRTIRYYGTIGLLDRPAAMRGRTALYNKKHAAQVVAIKRFQTTGKSLAEIQALWPTLDDATLSRMSGVDLPAAQKDSKARAGRKEFWKAEPAPQPASKVVAPAPRADAHTTSLQTARAAAALAPAYMTTELRIELVPNTFISIAMSDDRAISPADVAAIRAAAAPLIAELARRRLAVHAEEGDDV